MSDSLKDISKLKVADLKRELKVRGLSTVGNKQELQDRLQVAFQDGTDSALLLDDTGPVDTEDILNEDDVLADEDDTCTNAPTDVGNTSLKRQLDEELDEDTVTSTPADKAQDNGQPAKKITLNRKALSQHTTPVTLETSEQENKPKETNEEKKVLKLSEVDMKERLVLRAAKFGAPTSIEAKKLARAARFGESTTVTTTDSKKKEARAAQFGSSASSVTSAGNVPEVNVDLLKKRAERFGIQPGSKIELVEIEERKKKRLERFGGAPAEATNGSAKVAVSKTESAPVVAKPGRIPIMAPSSSSSATSKASLEEKKKLRGERFKAKSAVSAK